MITITVEGVEPLLMALSRIPGAIEKASRTAVRDALKGARQDVARKVAERYTISPGAITSTIKTRATGGLNGELKSKGAVNPLQKFKHTLPSRRRGEYIYIEVVRGQGGVLKKAFQGKGSILERLTSARYPLRGIAGPSAPGMLSTPEVSEVIMDGMERRIGAKLERAANAILGGYL